MRIALIALLSTFAALAGCSQSAETESSDAESGEFAESSAPSEPTMVAPEPSFGVDARPVRIGLDGPDFDACGSYGQITGLKPDGDNYLSVRAAPTTQARELDRLGTGTGISLCDSANGWIGIVYEGSGAGGGACGVGSPVPSERDYNGPCRSGWVSERFVEVIAG